MFCINENYLYGLIHDNEVALPLKLYIANDYEALYSVFGDVKLNENVIEEMNAFLEARRKYREVNENTIKRDVIYKDDVTVIYKRKDNPPEYVKVECDIDTNSKKIYLVSNGHLYRSKLIEEQLKLEGY